ncbi:D-xylose ABC transporter ATP-binding protein [Mesorhizobium sanjuanii]|uniref:D-xylose ABC transporter ATP-binding protein n=1 Tax=Mesorhizobium sanjuanii TaxID=2037900 RepID=A0A2A6FCF6_9HYPH|nr:sugar ABC transporter ATP-binding protein [Mesorhizobium sanjuanii]PDQ19660.1 D-xylose ABC transporter ATP-binding protein [Mesorhizobium sanjuanii]
MTLTASNLRKTYGQTRAVDGVSVVLRPGIVHAIVGENGAGKSTTLRMLAGAERPDSGEMTLDDARYAPPSVIGAAALGVSLVYQEITINRSLSVAENIFIDRLRQFTGRLGLIDRRRMEGAAQTILERIGAQISVSAETGRLNLGELKCIEIARALSTDPKILLLDESTAYLDHREVQAVLRVISELKGQGMTVAFVSHHLDEVIAVADELTILKDGQFVGTYRTAEIEPHEIHRRMVGRELAKSIYPPRPAKDPGKAARGSVVLEVSDVAVGRELSNVSLDVCGGEILGLAGLKGAGAEALFAAICGDLPMRQGSMTLAGEPYAPSTPTFAWRQGVAHLPGDRNNEGLIAEFSVLDNLVMAHPPHHGPLFDRAAAIAIARDLIAQVGIKTQGVDASCRSLSGGNLQKVVIGKCLAVGPRLLLLNNPTRGVDVGARAEIYRIIRQKAAQGVAVILSSEDMSELIGMSDRLLVLRQGYVTHRIENAADVTEHDIIGHMA